MRVVVQRVKQASVAVDGKVVGAIDRGLLVLLAIHKDDKPEDTQWLVNKVVNLRIFKDDDGKMNRSVKEVGGEVLVVSQFTLYGNCVNGRRPDFLESATGPDAKSIYTKFAEEVALEMGSVKTGEFGASMEVSLVNDGPVTLLIDGKKSA